jgi:predicted phosphodiesterase
MHILLRGDLHGRLDALPDILRNAKRDLGVTSCIQVGDFGWSAPTLQRLARLPMPVHALDGNHDDHIFLAQARRRGLTRRWARELDLHLLPRGGVLDLNGVSIGVLGGALHAHQTQTRSPANYVTARDVRTALSTWRKVRPPVVITHSCPAGIGIGMQADPSMRASVDRHCRQAGFDVGPDHDCGEPGLTELWRAMDWRPTEWCFGHFHTLHQWVVEGTCFTCVGSGDGTDGSAGVRSVVLDLSHADHPRVLAKSGVLL